jgi:hypothetical protein
MNSDQKIDYEYHADKLLRLVARRDKLPAGSDQIPALNVEISATDDLVRSYRLVSGRGTSRHESNQLHAARRVTEHLHVLEIAWSSPIGQSVDAALLKEHVNR